ncbi:hypothetical protein R83H12_01862 [Fibrobacteria bacterium R8-3-H12]
MAENLNTYAENSKCYGDGVVGVFYDSIAKNCATYGRLYDWATALNINASCNYETLSDCGATVLSKHKGICPEGWHIPSNAEWDELSNYVQTNKGCTYCNAIHLKATSGWNSWSNQYSTDDYGFSALPAGADYSIDVDNGSTFSGIGYYGYWWSSEEEGNSGLYALNREIRYDYEYIIENQGNNKDIKQSVRCVMD